MRFPFAVNDCFDEIKPYVKFITKNNGGEGAVREICDFNIFIKKMNNNLENKIILITGVEGQLGKAFANYLVDAMQKVLLFET